MLASTRALCATLRVGDNDTAMIALTATAAIFLMPPSLPFWTWVSTSRSFFVAPLRRDVGVKGLRRAKVSRGCHRARADRSNVKHSKDRWNPRPRPGRHHACVIQSPGEERG